MTWIRTAGFAAIALLASCEKQKNATDPDQEQDPSMSRTHSTDAVAGDRIENIDAELLERLRRRITSEAQRARLQDIMSSMSDGALNSLLDILYQTRNSSRDRGVFSMALGELAKRDPEAALGRFHPRDMLRNEAGWHTVAGILAEARPALLESWLLDDLSAASTEIRGHYLLRGLDAFAHGAGPEYALRFYRELPEGILSESNVINSVFLDYGRASPSKAAEAAAMVFEGRHLDHALYNIGLSMGADDRAEAIKWAERISDTRKRNQLMAVHYRNWMDAEPDSVLTRLEELDPGQLGALFRNEAEVPATESLVEKIGRLSPDTLRNMLGPFVATNSNQKIFTQAVESLASSSPDNAMALIESMPDGGMKSDLYGRYFDTVAAGDPQTALGSFSELPAGNVRTTAYRELGESTGAKGFESTLSVMDSIPEADRADFLGTAIPYLVNENPHRVAGLLADGSLPISEDMKQDTLPRLGKHLYQSNPEGTRDWLNQLPDEDQPAAMRGVAAEMVRSDIRGFTEMLSSLPKNETWATGVRTLAGELDHADPEMAARWRDQLTEAGFE